MIKNCTVCGRMIHNEDRVIAIVDAVYHSIPSAKAFALEYPKECYELQHEYCWRTDGE